MLILRRSAAALAAALMLLTLPAVVVAEGFETGSPGLESVSSITFSPKGVLFVGDSMGGSIVALDIQDNAKDSGSGPIRIEQIDRKVAAALGVDEDDLIFDDMAIHPTSKKVYLSLYRGRDEGAQPALLRVDRDGKIENIDLGKVRFSKVSITDAPGKDQKDRRGRSLRTQTITDMHFVDGELLVAGLSNEEFASTLRRIPFPFKGSGGSSSVEIYHGAHGQYETHAPIRTFLPYEHGGESHILAAYTCTPLVTMPVKKLRRDTHVKGKTVAELGYGNQPLDIVRYKKEGKDYFLMANSRRATMRLEPAAIAKAEDITEPIGREIAGVDYTPMPAHGILHLGTLDDENVVMLQRDLTTGDLHIATMPSRWL